MKKSDQLLVEMRSKHKAFSYAFKCVFGGGGALSMLALFVVPAYFTPLLMLLFIAALSILIADSITTLNMQEKVSSALSREDGSEEE